MTNYGNFNDRCPLCDQKLDEIVLDVSDHTDTYLEHLNKDYQLGVKNTGFYYQCGSCECLVRSMKLTQEGYERWDDVVGVAFDYIRLIQEADLLPYYQENQRLENLRFSFGDMQSPVRAVNSIARVLQDVPPQNVLDYRRVYNALDRELLKKHTSSLSLLGFCGLQDLSGGTKAALERSMLDIYHQGVDKAHVAIECRASPDPIGAHSE